MKHVTVLGCGTIGATLARDLAGDPSLHVTVLDVSRENLRRAAGIDRLAARQADLSTPEAIRAAVADADAVAGAMPSTMGLMVLRAVIEAGKPYADISFMAQDATQLSGLARQRGVTAVVDCGVAPGLANLIIGRCAARMDAVENVTYYVGGLPRRRSWPFQYKAPFSPLDVIEEYTRPARLLEDGRLVTKPALSDPELIEFDSVGTLEGFNTDGLRSLLHTIPARNMREKTLRYPGHAELMRVLREAGFFRGDEVALADGRRVRPIDLTGRLLMSAWELPPGEPEFTILRVRVEGSAAGRPVRHVWELFDSTDAATGTSSMARTTGFPCAIVARLMATGDLHMPGVWPPEALGPNEAVFDRIMTELAARGVVFTRSADGEAAIAPAD